LYDLFYADKPYTAEAEFVHSCLDTYGPARKRRVLELACGTGTHAIALGHLGYSVVATDYSEPMLAVARRKAGEVGASVSFQNQDMTALALGSEQFGAAICLFDAIGYVATNEAITKVLDGVRRHLVPRGLFVFEFWHAAAMLRSYEALRVRRWHTEEGEILRLAETTIDCERQLAHVHYTIYELSRDGTYTCLNETQSNRYFLVQEMSAFLARSGFTPLKWFAGFSNTEIITENTWHVVAVANRV
jgi:SAM-dependent methyltransferase